MGDFLRRLLIVAAIFIGWFGIVATPVFAYTSPGVPDGYVNDFADVLTSDQEAQLSAQLHQHKASTTNQVGIVTVQTTGDESIEQYAVQLFQEWGIGKKEKDNGVLLLLAIQDRKLRIEVGYGLEPVLTDAKSARIIRGATPFLREGDYPTAIHQMTDEILSTLEKPQDAVLGEKVLTEQGGESEASRQEQIFFVAFLSFLFFMIIGPTLAAIYFSKKRGYWQTGTWGGSGGGSSADSSSSSSSLSSSSSGSSLSSSGSHDSFGGGSSGGGGASGSW